jgi:thymidine kinase
MFNIRKYNDKYIFEGEQVAIDGNNKITYEAICPHCYYEKLNNCKK